MPYTVYEYAQTRGETLGQSWSDEEFVENFSLCRHQTIRRQFAKYLKPADKVLEAGCGLGRWVHYLLGSGYSVVGIEASERAVTAAREVYPDLPISVGDVLRTGFADGHFDAVISLGVMEHFEEGPGSVLLETNRILKPEGILFVSIPPANLIRNLISHPKLSLYTALIRLLGRRLVFSEYRYSVEQFASHLSSAGFEILEIVSDELDPPKNMGLYVDFPSLRHRHRKWELNKLGVMIQAALARVSERLACGGVLFVCRKV